MKDINFQFHENKKYFFFGRTGTGKSLLLDSLAGLYKNYEGKILKNSDQRIAAGYLFQKNVLVPWLTAQENLELVGAKDDDLLHSYLDKFNLDFIKGKKASLLSGGETQVINLIRALMLKPKILFSDEPFNSVDHVTKKRIYLLLNEYFQKNPVTMFAVSHDLEEICLLADEVLYFDQDKKGLVAVLPKAEITVQNLYDLLSDGKIGT